MDHPIANSLLRAHLQTVKRISGSTYLLLLQRAGLERYVSQLPPLDEAPACSAEAYSRLPAAVLAMLGEPLTRRFLRNSGATMVARAMQNPSVVALAAHLAGLPPETRLGGFVQQLARIVDHTWATTVTAEDATAYYLITYDCPTCRQLYDLSAPICATSSASYSGLAAALVGRPVRVVEVECRATGGAVCRFAFYK
ncbi:MAG: 4-vinyl reductase [Chloroflexota bacterium]|nr:4-vinyl reductase [Chloroflexota bacterium]